MSEIRLSEAGWGNPQKLPYLKVEKSVDTRYTKNKTPSAIFILLLLTVTVPEINVFIIQEKVAIKIKSTKSACLLKSKTSEDQGIKKTGVKKTSA